MDLFYTTKYAIQNILNPRWRVYKVRLKASIAFSFVCFILFRDTIYTLHLISRSTFLFVHVSIIKTHKYQNVYAASTFIFQSKRNPLFYYFLSSNFFFLLQKYFVCICVFMRNMYVHTYVLQFSGLCINARLS